MPKTNHRVSLTDRKVKALPPAAEGKRYQVMDAEVPGFGVRVTDTGVRTFIFRTRFPGSTNPNRRELGRYPITTLAEAREKARQWRILVKQGIDPGVEEARQRAALAIQQVTTFGSVAEIWFKEKVATERKGAEVERDIRNNFNSLWALPIVNVADADIRAIIKGKKEVAPAAARNLLGSVKRFFSWVVDQGCYSIAASPCDRLKAAKLIGKKKRGNRILSDDELFALWRAASREKYPFREVYRILMLTAVRLNEAADAGKTELDRLKGVWTIPAARMKGDDDEPRPHAVPLISDVTAVFDSLPQLKGGPFLFSTTFGKKAVWIGDVVKKRLDKRMLRTLRALARRRGEDPAGVELPNWTNHDIRRTVRSNLSRLKVAEEVREAVLAHARPGIKGTYDLYDYFDEKREALELWAARLRSIVDPPPSNVIKLRATA
jgi:hypothetical protein